MSLGRQKGELFGAASSSSATSAAAGSRPKPVSSSKAPTTTSSSSSKSAAAAAAAAAVAARRPQHLRDAAEAKKSGLEYMTKTWKRWKADPFSAASQFERAGRSYRAAGEDAESAEMYHEAGVCHAASNNLPLAAKCFGESAALFVKMGKVREAVEEYKQASEAWLAGAEEGKAGEALGKAAQVMEQAEVKRGVGSSSAAGELHLKAVCTLVPDEVGVGDDFIKVVGAKDVFENAQRYFVEAAGYSDALEVMRRYSIFLEAEDASHTLFKLYLAECLLHLASDDSVKADQVYRERHLQSTAYLHAQECALEEKFIEAFKNFDGEALASAQQDRILLRLDPYLVRLAKTLCLGADLGLEDSSYGGGRTEIAPAAVPREGGIEGVKARMKSLGLDGDESAATRSEADGEDEQEGGARGCGPQTGSQEDAVVPSPPAELGSHEQVPIASGPLPPAPPGVTEEEDDDDDVDLT